VSKKDDDNWAGKGFGKRNEESKPEPKPDEEDPEAWVWK
jgi:hypothetical protein